MHQAAILRRYMAICETSMSRILYHSSEQPFDIMSCHPFTHFGDQKAALRRILWMVDGRHQLSADHPNHVYGVEFVGEHPLWVHDAGYNHNWPSWKDILDRAVTKQTQSFKVDYTNPDHGQRLADAVRQLGYDCVAYRNRAEGGTSYVALGPDNIRRVLSDEIVTGNEARRLIGL